MLFRFAVNSRVIRTVSNLFSPRSPASNEHFINILCMDKGVDEWINTLYVLVPSMEKGRIIMHWFSQLLNNFSSHLNSLVTLFFFLFPPYCLPYYFPSAFSYLVLSSLSFSPSLLTSFPLSLLPFILNIFLLQLFPLNKLAGL